MEGKRIGKEEGRKIRKEEGRRLLVNFTQVMIVTVTWKAVGSGAFVRAL